MDSPQGPDPGARRGPSTQRAGGRVGDGGDPGTRGRRAVGWILAAGLGVAAGLVILRVAGGAAAGPPEPGARTLRGRLVPGESPALPEDGSLYEDHVISAAAGWRLTASMASDEFDAWLQVFGPDGAPLAQNDDGPGGGTDAWLSLRCPGDGRYVLRANARDPGMAGAYRLEVELRPARAEGADSDEGLAADHGP